MEAEQANPQCPPHTHSNVSSSLDHPVGAREWETGSQVL